MGVHPPAAAHLSGGSVADVHVHAAMTAIAAVASRSGFFVVSSTTFLGAAAFGRRSNYADFASPVASIPRTLGDPRSAKGVALGETPVCGDAPLPRRVLTPAQETGGLLRRLVWLRICRRQGCWRRRWRSIRNQTERRRDAKASTAHGTRPSAASARASHAEDKPCSFIVWAVGKVVRLA